MEGGHHDLRDARERWRADGWRVLGRWARRSLVVAVALLVATALVAGVAQPDPASFDLAGVTRPGTWTDVREILTRNLLVLALHAMACVAAYLARRAVVIEAAGYRPVWQRMHTRVGAVALAFVALATLVSFATQAIGLGRTGATVADGLGISAPALIATVALHALPELTAVFLPLAAWWSEGRSDRWNDLLAATFVTVALALPILVLTATLEVFVTPHLLAALVG